MTGLDVASRMHRRGSTTEPIMLMLSSVGQSAEMAHAADIGIRASLTKPVRQSVLKDAILSVLGTRAPVVESAPEGAAVATPERVLSVLLAEDNVVNQRLFVAVLRKQGHTVSIVDNGQAAVEAAAKTAFDVILMDLQMPVMGGLDATARIREAEAGTDRHVPIVALTAHALKGDRERCLEAGMDDYLAKPVQASVLLSVIQAVARGSSVSSGAAPTPVRQGPIDIEEALSRVDGDRALLAELAQIFGEQARTQLATLDAAIAAGDAGLVERTAHTLRGAIANFGAHEAVRLAQQLETAGRERQLTSASSLLARLVAESTEVERALGAFVDGATR